MFVLNSMRHNDETFACVVHSKLTVTTCHTTAHVGTKLLFSHSGQLVSQTPCPRQVYFITVVICLNFGECMMLVHLVILFLFKYFWPHCSRKVWITAVANDVDDDEFVVWSAEHTEMPLGLRLVSLGYVVFDRVVLLSKFAACTFSVFAVMDGAETTKDDKELVM